MNKKVLVAMSGGVDSSVACYLLKKRGYQCIGATIKTWPKEECGDSRSKACCSLDAVNFARSVAHNLNIPHYVFDFSKQFNEHIKDYFFREYKKGRTPNPCVWCNSKIKFGLLLTKAQALGCKFIASGHYARNISGLLKKGKDKSKDQSYFLFNLNQKQLKHVLFPLGGMTKEKVRNIAKRIGLKSHDRKSSQDICFTHIQKNMPSGKIFFQKQVIGTHRGINRYTIGQRKGLGVAFREPLYVCEIDHKANSICTGTKTDLYKRNVLIEDGFISLKQDDYSNVRLKAKIRYQTPEAACTVKSLGKRQYLVSFDKPQSSVTPGQAIVFYKKSLVAGGGWIKKAC